MRADQLLERGHLAELRVVLAEEQQVRGVGHRVLALEAHDRVRAEQRRRVLALDPVLVEVAHALRAEDDRAELLRADHAASPTPGWAATAATRPGWSSSSSSTVRRWSCPVNQTSPRLPEPTTAIVDASARRRHLLVRRGRRRRPSSGSASAARATRRPDALAPGDLRQERVDERRALGLGLRLDERRAAAHQVADDLAEALAVALLERRAEALAVVGQDDELVRPRRVLGRLHRASRSPGRRRRAPRTTRRAPGRSGGPARRSR